MSLFCAVAIFTVLYTTPGLSIRQDYYWREYTGKVPEDAVIAGQDPDGRNIYIGQAYIKNEGLITAQIIPGVREVKVPIKGIKTVNKHIKVLCGPQEKFYWMSTRSSTLHLDLIDKHAVIGGHEDGLGNINIGRISHEGKVKIGKINSFNVENANFFFNDNGLERLITSYQILMYSDSSVDVRVKSF